MNTVTLIGTLTKDPEIRNGNGETQVCRMRVAESNGRKNSPLFINVSAFGRQAETCGRYLVKGRQVAVSGAAAFPRVGERRLETLRTHDRRRSGRLPRQQKGRRWPGWRARRRRRG